MKEKHQVAKVLVVVAHPDDEVLGCGGTIAKHTQQGNEVYCLILGEGVTSRHKSGRETAGEELRRLKSEARQAAMLLGIKEVFFKDFPDNRFDTVSLLEIVRAIEEVKDNVKPEIVYTHHQGDLNIDHQLTFKAVLTTCRPLSDETVRAIYSFEIPSSTGWYTPEPAYHFVPDVFIDISETFEKKIEALKTYTSEAREYPHPRSPEALKAIARYRGANAGIKLAEAFKLVRLIG